MRTRSRRVVLAVTVLVGAGLASGGAFAATDTAEDQAPEVPAQMTTCVNWPGNRHMLRDRMHQPPEQGADVDPQAHHDGHAPRHHNGEDAPHHHEGHHGRG